MPHCFRLNEWLGSIGGQLKLRSYSRRIPLNGCGLKSDSDRAASQIERFSVGIGVNVHGSLSRLLGCENGMSKQGFTCTSSHVRRKNKERHELPSFKIWIDLCKGYCLPLIVYYEGRPQFNALR